MKLHFLLALITTMAVVAYPQELSQLSLHKDTPHLKIFCTPLDKKAAAVIFKHSTDFLKDLVWDFHHCPTQPLTIAIYPDLPSFHRAINWSEAPEWAAACSTGYTSIIVSPDNPGTYHTHETIVRTNNANLAAIFIKDAYPTNTIPVWLQEGIALFKSNTPISYTKLAELIEANKPAVMELINIQSDTCTGFDKNNGLSVAPALVAFIVETWGWEHILKLLSNYQDFETILGISKTEFQEKWIDFVLKKATEN